MEALLFSAPETPWEAPPSTKATQCTKGQAAEPILHTSQGDICSLECSTLVSQFNNSQDSSDSDITFTENLLAPGSNQELCPPPCFPQLVPVPDELLAGLPPPTHTCTDLLDSADPSDLASAVPPPVCNGSCAQQVVESPILPNTASGSKRARFDDPCSNTQPAAQTDAQYACTTSPQKNKKQRTSSLLNDATATQARTEPQASAPQQGQSAGVTAAVSQTTQRAIIGILKKVSGLSAPGGTTKRVRFMNLKDEEEEPDFADHLNWEAGAAYALWSMTRAF